MKKPTLLLLMVLTATYVSRMAYADDAFDNRFYVAPMGSLGGNRNTQLYEDGVGGGVAIGKILIPHLGVEIVGDYLHYDLKNAKLTNNQNIYVGGGAINLYASSSSAEGAFLHADAEGGNRFVYNLGLGYDSHSLIARCTSVLNCCRIRSAASAKVRCFGLEFEFHWAR